MTYWKLSINTNKEKRLKVTRDDGWNFFLANNKPCKQIPAESYKTLD